MKMYVQIHKIPKRSPNMAWGILLNKERWLRGGWREDGGGDMKQKATVVYRKQDSWEAREEMKVFHENIQLLELVCSEGSQSIPLLCMMEAGTPKGQGTASPSY